MDYKLTELQSACEVTSSKRIYAKELCSYGVPFYRSKEIIEKLQGAKKHSNPLYISECRYQEIIRKSGSLVEGDLLLTSRGTLGVPYIVTANDRFHFADGNLTWFRNFKGLDSRYLKYFFLSPVGKGELGRCVIGSSQAAYTIASLKKISIPLPDLEYQLKVVDILSTYDNLIENNNRRIAILEEMGQSLYREWFVKFSFPGHQQCQMVDSPLGSIPEGWNYCSFTKVADVLSGGTPKTKEPTYWGGDIPFFAPKDAPTNYYCLETEKQITELGLSKCSSKLYPKNTVLITARGTVGKVVLPALPMAMNQSCYALKSKVEDTQRYLYLLTKAQVSYLKKNTGGATFDTIIKDTFERMMIVEPPEDLKKQFESMVAPIFDQILNLSKQSENLKIQRDLLLPKLISGQIDLSQAEQGAA